MIWKNSDVLYLTSFNPFIYRRPIFAKMAMPELKIIDYGDHYMRWMSGLGKSLHLIHRDLRKIERKLLRTPRISGDYLVSAYLNDFLRYLPVSKIKAKAIITLNTPLALVSKQIVRNHSVIIDWMDVWMWPWDEMNPLDIRAVEEADGVIFWSKPFMDLMAKRLKIKKCTYVPYGVNLKDFDPLKSGNGTSFRIKFKLEGKFLITYSGSVWRPDNLDLQGIDKLLKAFQLVSNRLRNAVLVLQLLNIDVQTLKLLKELNIKDKTIIIGKLPFTSSDRLDIFSATDLFIAPTTRHPISYYAERMKFFQYMAAGKPILAEEAPGTKSVFSDAAYYVKLDNINAMADAILKLYDDEDLRGQLGCKCRKRLEDLFEWSKLMPTYRNFIASIPK
jgi:glycosyltransferase involved in cell wall biosynthesis